MSHPEEYDVVVLGSGAAGKLLAWTLASQGKRTAVIERRYVGGSCPNIACLPSKNVIHGAKVASYFRRGAEFGIATGDWKVDMAAVRDRKRKMVDGLVALHLEKYRESGAELVMGHGRFVAPKTIEVALNAGGTRTLRGQTVVIDTGSRARIDDTPGLAESRPLTHVEALELDHLPEHLIVLGGGYVGLELAQAFRRFGSRVTVVERNGALIHREDPDVTEAVEQLFRDEGIEVLTGTAVDRVEGRSGESVRLHTAPRRDRGDAPARRRGPHAEHRRHRPGEGRGRDGRARARQGRRAAPDDGRGRLGGGRLRRQPVLHAHRRGRLPRGAGQPHRRGPRDDRAAGAVLPVHRPGAGPGRAERAGGPRARRRLPPGQDPDGGRAAGPDALRDAGVPQGADRGRTATASSASPRSGPRPARSWPWSRSRCWPACPTRRCGTPS